MDDAAVRKKILNYLGQKQPAVALMISGGWGAGKTYYLDNNREKLELSSGKKLVMLSVAGLSTREELEHALFSASAPWMRNGYVEAAAPLAKAAMRLVKVDPADFKKLAAKFTPGRVAVVLDDADRFTGGSRVLAGFLIDLVDQSRLHAVLVASEDDMPEAKEFAVLKEKIIGSTLRIDPDINERVRWFIKEIVPAPVSQLLVLHEIALKLIAVQWGVGNLRLIKHALLQLAELLDELAGQMDSIRDHQALLIGGVFIGLLELSCGPSHKAEVVEFFSRQSLGAAAAEIYVWHHRMQGVVQPLRSSSPSPELADDHTKWDLPRRYASFGLTSFPGSEAFVAYFKDGVIDAPAMLAPFQVMQRRGSGRELLLRNYRKLPQADFEREASALLGDFESGKIRSLPDIVITYLTLRHFTVERMIDADWDRLVAIALKAIDRIDASQARVEDVEISLWPYDLYAAQDKAVGTALTEKRDSALKAIKGRERLAVLDPSQTAAELAAHLSEWGDFILFAGDIAPIAAMIDAFSPDQLHVLAQFLQRRIESSEKQMDWLHEPRMLRALLRTIRPDVGGGQLTVLQAERLRLAEVMKDYVFKVRAKSKSVRIQYFARRNRDAQFEKTLLSLGVH